MIGNPSTDTNPSFAPDGGWVVFTSPRNGSAHLYRVRLDGTRFERLTDHKTFDHQIVRGLEKITVNVKRLVHARNYYPRGTKPPQVGYLLFGTSGDLLLAHAIFQPPDFDHVVGITVKGAPLSAKDLAGDLGIVFSDRKNVAAERHASRRS